MGSCIPVFLSFNISIMTKHKADPPVGGTIIVLLVLLNAIILKEGVVNNDSSWAGLVITFSLLLIATVAMRRTKFWRRRN